MASVTVSDDEIVVRFNATEIPLVARQKVTIPLSAVKEVAVLEKSLATQGARRAGMFVTGVMKVGLWGTGTGVQQLVSVRRGTPALRIILDKYDAGLKIDEVMVSISDAASVADDIERRRGATR
ncbi:hypothetical protein C1701_26660 [Actinoalloteichus sp. AHMU CJ021]|uniref:hypothetical protein n=1 Tax=Actinoalloteichus TaxID=65496 RepID=UPI0003823F99|nr:hypothetical protein [Actinoalloteichus spitiensis]AUS81306.1 hypothetical protein C1701_26660 [Actinoalloteichus sp. AHMU CJ021]WIW78589.1 CgpE [Actinoalloteichus caeruleus]